MKKTTLIGSTLSAAIIVGASAYLLTPTHPPRALGAAMQPTPGGVTDEVLATTLTRLGLDAKALTAAGCDSTDVIGVVTLTRAHLEGLGQPLSEADDRFALATTDHDALFRLAQRGEAEEVDLIDYTDARLELLAARTSLDSALSGVRQIAEQGLTAGQRNALAEMRDNRDAFGAALTTEYAAAVWTEADWVELRNATVAARQATDNGEAVDQSIQDIIDDAMAIPAVASAKGDLDTNLVACQAAWDSTIISLGE